MNFGKMEGPYAPEYARRTIQARELFRAGTGMRKAAMYVIGLDPDNCLTCARERPCLTHPGLEELQA